MLLKIPSFIINLMFITLSLNYSYSQNNFEIELKPLKKTIWNGRNKLKLNIVLKNNSEKNIFILNPNREKAKLYRAGRTHEIHIEKIPDLEYIGSGNTFSFSAPTYIELKNLINCDCLEIKKNNQKKITLFIDKIHSFSNINSDILYIRLAYKSPFHKISSNNIGKNSITRCENKLYSDEVESNTIKIKLKK